MMENISLMGRFDSGLISRAFMLKMAAMKDNGSCCMPSLTLR